MIEVRTNRPEEDRLVRQIFARVSRPRIKGEHREGFSQLRIPSIGGFDIVLSDELPDIVQVLVCFLSQDVLAHAMRFLRCADFSWMRRNDSSAVTYSPRSRES